MVLGLCPFFVGCDTVRTMLQGLKFYRARL